MLLIAASITRKFWVVTSTSSGRFLSAGRKRSGGTLCNAARLPTLWETTLPSKKSKQDKDKQTSKALLEASSNTAAADAAATAASATADCCARLDVGILRENGNIVENCLPVAMEARSGSSSVEQKRKLNIVVEGCCHGELPKIYASVEKMERVRENRHIV